MRLSLLNLTGSTNAFWRIEVAERACPGVGVKARDARLLGPLRNAGAVR
jgi:hypothetical protein